MGRAKKGGGGGMKGFVKQTRLAKGSSVKDDDVSSPSATEEEDDAPLDAQTETKRHESIVDLATETKSQLRERHKKEMNAAKKEAAKLGKKKKQEATDYVESVRARHERELEAIRARDEESEEEEVREESAEVFFEEKSTRGEKKSKAQKRREKEAKLLEDREARIREDLEQLGVTERQSEEESLKERLDAIGCCIYEIRPDGHCLFKAIEDQLRQLTDVTQKLSFQELREMAAEELRAHRDQYAPFYVQEAEEGSFLEHCESIASTAEWGGELEIQALSEKLQRKMIIYSVNLGEKIVGESFEGSPIRLCFMQHAYHLGAHYNSVRTKARSIL